MPVTLCAAAHDLRDRSALARCSSSRARRGRCARLRDTAHTAIHSSMDDDWASSAEMDALMAQAEASRTKQRTAPQSSATAPLAPVTNTVAAPSRAARPARPPSLPELDLHSANSLVNRGRDFEWQDCMHSPAWQPDDFPPNTLHLKLGQEVELIKPLYGMSVGATCIVSHLSSNHLLEATELPTRERHPLFRIPFETDEPCPWRRRQFPVRPLG